METIKTHFNMNSIKSNRKSMAAPKWLGNSLFFVMCLAIALQLMFVVKAVAQQPLLATATRTDTTYTKVAVLLLVSFDNSATQWVTGYKRSVTKQDSGIRFNVVDYFLKDKRTLLPNLPRLITIEL